MLKLQTVFPDMDLLKEVDVLSSVSGGSLAAAYYAASKDPDESVTVEMPSAPTAVIAEPRFRYELRRSQLTAYGPVSDRDLEHLRSLFPDDPETAQRLSTLQNLSKANAKVRQLWRPSTVKALMSRDYVARMFGRFFYPPVAARYWWPWSNFGRSEIMQRVFEANLFYGNVGGRGLSFADLNPERPYLVLNSTDATQIPHEPALNVFAFTSEEFDTKLPSQNLAGLPVARGVMASAAFPAVFSYINLRYSDAADTRSPTRWRHLFDGGNYDNLGLTSAATVITSLYNANHYKRFAVILVDAYTEPKGVSATDMRPGHWITDRLIDSNFLKTFDSLLARNRKALIEWFKRDVMAARPVTFCQINFAGLRKRRPDLKVALDDIPTTFRLNREQTELLDRAASELVRSDDRCLLKLRRHLLATERDPLGIEN